MYFTQLKQRRERYHGGLKQLAEHMNVVTRTMSNDPNSSFTQDTPQVHSKFQHAARPGPSGQNGAYTVTDVMTDKAIEVALPMTPIRSASGRRLSSYGDLSEARRALEARRLSKFKNLFDHS